MSSAPAASVIICSNRPLENLGPCLESLRNQSVGGGFEVIVVDNAPIIRAIPDNVRRIEAKLPLRWGCERQIGLSNARNLGARLATGEILAYIDDDVTAERGWLQNLAEPFVDDHVACVGGAISLSLPVTLPRWYGPALEGWFSRYDPPLGISQVADFAELPYGANLALRRSLWEQLGGFDVSIGRRGRDWAGGEDLEFCLRAMAAGYSVLRTSAARVLHHISADRLTMSYLWRVSRQAGLTLARLDPAGSRAKWMRESLILLLKSCYPFANLGADRRLNYLLRSRLFGAAAMRRRPNSRPAAGPAVLTSA